MARLANIPLWRHGALGALVAVGGGLSFAGVFDPAPANEVFDAKTVVVQPVGSDGLRITEYVDQDFGRNERRGYQRLIPNDFGEPTDVVASSPDAPADVNVVSIGQDTRIRVGDPGVTLKGQHRYELSYTLPESRLSSGELALDIIGNEETIETKRFEVIVVGLELTDPKCNVGSFNVSGGCTLTPGEIDGARVYTAVIEPLRPGDGITIGGTITGRPAPATVPVPAIVGRRPSTHPDQAAGFLAVGSLSGALAFLLSRRIGRNAVGGGGAADAAYADQGTTRMVTDAELARMATVEFVPPKGVPPWLGAALLTEQVDSNSVAAWFSGLAALGVVDLDNANGTTTMTLGANASKVSGPEADLLARAFAGGSTVEFGKYDADFATAWRRVYTFQRQQLAAGRYWRQHGPKPAGVTEPTLSPGLKLAVGVAALLLVAGAVLALSSSGRGGWGFLLITAIAVPAVAGFILYRRLLPSRTAAGSALALRTESFRRFLAASEAKHVEWAWRNNLLREYSAWAVALGEARAWQQAMLASSVVPPSELSHGPMVIWYAGPQIHSTTVRPQPTGGGGHGGGWGGGGFGGFSGGSVGGGGGGGSSGSW